MAGCCLAAGCRKIELVNPTEYEVLPFGEDPDADPIGMYLLNEGNMGSNKADLDYLDYRTAVYARGIYAEKNPNVVKELGDVGNDIQIYDGRLFAVINCSHKVEVMDAYTARRITQIDIPNCRYIRFKGKYAYVSAYVGPVAMDPNAQKGAVFKVDLDTYKIVGQVTVGYQPDELAIIGGRAYVYSVEYSNQTSKNTVTYAIIDVKKKRVVSRKFITDGTELDIVIPYGIAIHPRNGDIYVTDAKNYVSSGVLHCYSREGVHKWSVRTGDIPAHMVFLERKQTRQ